MSGDRAFIGLGSEQTVTVSDISHRRDDYDPSRWLCLYDWVRCEMSDVVGLNINRPLIAFLSQERRTVFVAEVRLFPSLQRYVTLCSYKTIGAQHSGF